jgi:hypothetical protein
MVVSPLIARGPPLQRLRLLDGDSETNRNCRAAPDPATSGEIRIVDQSAARLARDLLLEIITRRKVQPAQRKLFDCAKGRPLSEGIAQDSVDV